MCYKFKLALLILIASVMSTPVSAVGLKAGHPDRYVVVRGDTLWDISGRFLSQPWRWPEIWQANPEIDNPHLIYPGDELYVQGGRVHLRRGGAVKLSPQMRVSELHDAIPAIPLDAIAQFLAHPRVVLTDSEHERAPYIVSVGREALLARPDSDMFVRGVHDASNRRFAIYRPGKTFFNPGVDGQPDELLGFESLHVGDGELIALGDPATVRLVNATREVRAGDRLHPVSNDMPEFSFSPHAPAYPLEGRILSVVDGVNQIGQYQIVVINLGLRDGIESGHVMAVFRAGGTVIDHFAKTPESMKPKWWHFRREPKEEVTLPDQRAGTLMVFRPFERVSYALVMEASRAMHVDDPIRTP